MKTLSKNIIALLGPTNTGKTHVAIDKMLKYESGIFGFPLRLLAREVYDKCVHKVGVNRVALITGEEKLFQVPLIILYAQLESMPKDKKVEFVAIDEIQMCGDKERAHIY